MGIVDIHITFEEEIDIKWDEGKNGVLIGFSEASDNISSFDIWLELDIETLKKLGKQINCFLKGG